MNLLVVGRQLTERIILPALAACAITGPGAVSPVGFTVSAPEGGVVTVDVAAGTATGPIDHLYFRAMRGDQAIGKTDAPWVRTGITVKLGSAGAPVLAGDRLAVGTSDVNTQFTIDVPASGSAKGSW